MTCVFVALTMVGMKWLESGRFWLMPAEQCFMMLLQTPFCYLVMGSLMNWAPSWSWAWFPSVIARPSFCSVLGRWGWDAHHCRLHFEDLCIIRFLAVFGQCKHWWAGVGKSGGYFSSSLCTSKSLFWQVSLLCVSCSLSTGAPGFQSFPSWAGPWILVMPPLYLSL